MYSRQNWVNIKLIHLCCLWHMRVSSSWGANWLTNTALDNKLIPRAYLGSGMLFCFYKPGLGMSRFTHLRTGRCKTEQKETTVRAAPSLRQASLQKRGPELQQPAYWVNREQKGWRKKNGVSKQKTSCWWMVRES